MKTSKIWLTYAFVAFLLLFFSSCKEDFLEIDHYKIVDSDQMFQSDADLFMGLNGCYDRMHPDQANETGATDWGFKPNLFTGCHPTMDTQATGWDANWTKQGWNADVKELLQGWRQMYSGICRCNEFLEQLATTEINPKLISAESVKICEGEARACRAFYYTWLAQTFGRVPMLETGETFINTPSKPRAESYDAMWDFIIDDLTKAADLLNWEPYNGQYNRCTKGMALSYVAEAYMWKAYRHGNEGTVATECWQKAAQALKAVIESGTYQLQSSFTTLWDPGAVWNKETIWAMIYDDGNIEYGGGGSNSNSYTFIKFFTACPARGGWGSLFLPWEWWSIYNKGDKRRDASGCTAKVTNINPDWKSDYCYGYNPYTMEKMDDPGALDTYRAVANGETAPAIWSLKYWRSGRANWDNNQRSTATVYFKRYANVLLDYAECLFRLNGENDATAWDLIAQVRNRAYGNLEVGKSADKYLTYYKDMLSKQKDDGKPVVITSYPLPFNTSVVPVPDAKTEYTALKAAKNYSSPVWLVALGTERRKEFNCEWCLRPDMQRSQFIADHIEHNYPKHTSTGINDWQSVREFDYDDARMDMPIPTQEVLMNPGISE